MGAKFERGVPVLPAASVDDSIAFYRDKLGFAETFRDATPASYAGMARDGVGFHLASVPAELARTIGMQTMCRFQVADIDALYEEYKRHEVIHPNGPLQTKPWGTREFGVIDPCGVCLTFYAMSE